MTPAVSEPTKPSGCPTAYASSPTWRAAAEHRRHDHAPARAPASRTAMSFSGRSRRLGAADLVPSAKETRIVVAPSTTWRAVRIAPRALTITPVPSPSVVAFRRGALRLDLDERRQDLLVDDGRGRRGRLLVLDRLRDDVRRDRPDLCPVERRRRTDGREDDHRDHDAGHERRCCGHEESPPSRLLDCGAVRPSPPRRLRRLLPVGTTGSSAQNHPSGGPAVGLRGEHLVRRSARPSRRRRPRPRRASTRPARTSPAAKTPGRTVSSRCGSRSRERPAEVPVAVAALRAAQQVARRRRARASRSPPRCTGRRRSSRTRPSPATCSTLPSRRSRRLTDSTVADAVHAR